MKRSMRGIALLIVIAGLMAWRPAGASPIVIGASADLGAVPTTAGTGLSGSIYQFSSEPTSWSSAATKIAASSGPLATFKTTSICYPDCAGHTANDSPETFSQYVGSGTNSNSFSYTSANQPTNIANSAIVITGYIAITQAGTYNFNLGSDDSSLLYIGGQQVVNNDGQKNFAFASSAVTFTQAGLYAITLDYAEASGSAGLEFSMSNSAGACVIGQTSNCTGGTTQTGAFYSSLPATPAPEPASLSVLVSGVAAIFGLRRRRRAA
ncbi:MAG TPA: PA14 domain-containing protein [Alphaproteobacteria bacterium]|nr:PA14 domain-containing protein [Alphaproteobacteria bacterium]